MTDLVHSIQTMPVGVLVPAGMLLLAGLILWLAGRRVFRSAFVLMGLLLGGLIGLIVGESLNLSVPHWVPPVLGGVGLAVTAAMTYRLAAAVALALVLGLACALSVMAVNDWQVRHGRGFTNEGDSQIDVNDSISDWIKKHDDPAAREKAKVAIHSAATQVSQKIDELAAKHGLQEQTSAGMEQMKTIGGEVKDVIKQRWSETPKQLKPMLSLSALIGGLSGLIFGLVARRFSVCAVTAMVGAALWLGAATVIALRLGAAEWGSGWWLPKSILLWLCVWLTASIIGLAIQWPRKSRPADKPA